jgi:SpoVK/Ycf46/Vps4 family AAA+-type ATPase
VTRNGLDQVHAEAHRLFDMLEACDQVVVLLDEFDELVRERESEGEFQSRFLTTAMLPKLAALSARRRIVYIIATNHLERFDVAIRRPGRFDLILPVMPPTSQEKLKRWPVLKERLDAIRAVDKTHAEELRRLIADLTYSECDALIRRLENVTDAAEFTRIVAEEGQAATLSQRVQPRSGADEPEETWRDRITGELERVRIPEPSGAGK